jgi:hypothetical protein
VYQEIHDHLKSMLYVPDAPCIREVHWEAMPVF